MKATYLRAQFTGRASAYPPSASASSQTSVGDVSILSEPGHWNPKQSWNLEGGIKQGFYGRVVSPVYLDVVAFSTRSHSGLMFEFTSRVSGGAIPRNLEHFAGLWFQRCVNTAGRA
jgi:hypothetical protein